MSNKEEILEQSLNDYKNQLSFVISALNENKSEDLIELKDKLEEIIALTEVDLISVKKSRLLSELNSGKYNTNNEDIEEEPKPSTSGSSTSSESSTSVSSDFLSLNELINGTNKSLIECLNELNGKECRAPFAQQNGSVDYHNAVIMISDTFDDSINDSSDLNVNDIKVKVFFTYPLNNAMLSCPHYMDGKCKYGDRKCKYSHGYYVSFANIKPFIELNYSTLTRDSLCLAKCQTDRLWYKAIIDDINDDNKVVVKYSDYDVIDTIGIEDIIPFSDDNPEECENKFINTIVDNDIEKEDQFIAWDCSSSAMAEWEVHTKGIGSKLMAKMGYVWGQGLGRNGEGITQPIEAFVFPTGKSLDTCMQLREKNALKDPLKVRIKLKAKKLAMESKIADRYNVVKHKESIFDFINTKVFAPKVETQIDPKNSKSLTLSTSQLKTSNTQSLNISSLKICEDLRKAESELKRLKAAIDRNKSKDKKIVLHLEEKVNKQNLLIKSLRDRESLILKEQKMRSNKQKLTIF